MPGLCFLAALNACIHKLTGNRDQGGEAFRPFSLLSNPSTGDREPVKQASNPVRSLLL